MSKILGFSEGFHDAAACIIDDGVVTFAAHDERFSRIKNNKDISPVFKQYVDDNFSYDYVAFYEKTYLKRLRHLTSRRWKHLFGHRKYAWKYQSSYYHHLSHAAAAFQTSPFQQATAVVVDAIGEFDTTSKWLCWYDNNGRARYRKLSSTKYPLSLGLFYSAMTDRVGLKPMEEEYIMMGMVAYGKERPVVYEKMKDLFMTNLHKGCKDFEPNISSEDIAFNAQKLTENLLRPMFKNAELPIVYGGGVAHNVLANGRLFKDQHYIFPNPGDAGSSVGAAALKYGKKVRMNNCYLGYDLPLLEKQQIEQLVDDLLAGKVVGVAAGKAEFGPRALGNRSLLADPRKPEVKERVNDIKRRQQFRPFAPSILTEHAGDYFRTLKEQSYHYMQYAVKCHRPEEIPSVVHYDGTSRVHTVSENVRKYTSLRDILELWYRKTGCPVLLDTSLNIKGEPMVNTIQDAKRFEEKYNIKVYYNG